MFQDVARGGQGEHEEEADEERALLVVRGDLLRRKHDGAHQLALAGAKPSALHQSQTTPVRSSDAREPAETLAHTHTA